VWDTVGQSIALRVTVWDYAGIARMEHISIRLPSDLVDALRSEGEAMGCGMSWAVRRRLEERREAGTPRSRQLRANEHHGGGTFQSPDGAARP
jgi:hypothetical protein